MKTSLLLLSGLCTLAFIAIHGQPHTIVTPVLTRSGSNLRHGAYTKSGINTSNISRLQKIYSIGLRNDARGTESQPLVMPGVQGSDGTTRDLIVLSSMANDVIAADLHTGKILWQTNLGRPIKGTKQIDFWGINDNFGILSTGVIDPDTFTWYGVTWTSPDGSAAKGWHSLHAVDLHTGNEVKKPLSMNPLTYNPGYGLEPAKFAGQMRKQRSALSLFTVQGRKVIAIPAGSVLETNGAASGWLSIADVAAWRFTASWASTVRGFGGGIWMAGQGVTIDPSTNDLLFLTANGSFDGTTDFSESFVRLRYAPPKDPYHELGRLDVQDWWSGWSDAGRTGQDPTASMPENVGPKITGVNAPTVQGRLTPPEVVNNDVAHHAMHRTMAMDAKVSNVYADQDLGSGSLVLLEKYGIIGGGGKDGIWYSVKSSNMGKTMPEDFAPNRTAANYAKLASSPIWFTFAAWHHKQLPNGQWVVDPQQPFEPTTPTDVTMLNKFSGYGGVTHHLHSSPVVAEISGIGTVVVCWGENGNLREWKANPDGSLTFLGNGQEIASPNSPQPPSGAGGMPGSGLAISSDGTKNAIIWALTPDGDANRQITTGKIYAYSAGDLAKYPDGSGWIKKIWESTMSAHSKFNVPVITGNYLIVPTYAATVEVYTIQ